MRELRGIRPAARHATSRAAAVLATALCLSALGGCTLVGYPAGGPGEAPAPAAAGAAARSGSGAASSAGSGAAAAELPAVMRSDAGRTYEVFGETYQVLDSADGFQQRGLASWYGEAFHGRPTASGETFDMHRLSAAHRTLPLHTWVEVTNLANGRRVVLRINDRGPFARTHERVIDLSYAAALELGVVGPGTATVDLRALRADEVVDVLGRR
jgi:rare lipoprotein A